MGSVERRQREKQALRGEILSAARDLFAEQGYESVSMRKIAERIEYSPTSIYLHFRDKAELFEAISNETFARLARTLQEIQEEGGDNPVKSLRRGLKAYIRFGLENPNHYRVTFMMNIPARSPEEFQKSAGMQCFGILLEIVQTCVHRKLFIHDDPLAVTQAIWASAHGVVTLLIGCESFPVIGRKELSSLVIDTMIEGLQA